MNVEKANLDKVRKLLSELENLESAVDILGNYDAEISAKFWSAHNHNTKQGKSVFVSLPRELREQICSHVNDRIFKIKEELQSM